VNVTVTTAVGTSPTSSADVFTYEPAGPYPRSPRSGSATPDRATPPT
jgi:hypothetical protein